jgi:hypothetical protein
LVPILRFSISLEWLRERNKDALFRIFGLEGTPTDTGGVCCQSAVNDSLRAINIQALTTPTVSVMFFGFRVSPPMMPASVVLDEVTNCY